MPTDLLLDDDFDLLLQGGDLVVGESTQQHQQLLLLTAKGEWREFPTRGAHLRARLLDDQPVGSLNGQIKREFTADGMRVERIRVSQGQVKVDANYE
jgi:hypothetical protein